MNKIKPNVVYKLLFALVCLSLIGFGAYYIKKKARSISRIINHVQYNKPLLRIKFVDFGWNFQLKEWPMLEEILTDKYRVLVNNDEYDFILYNAINYEHKRKIDEKKDIIKVVYSFEATDDTKDIDLFDLSIGSQLIDHPQYVRVPWYYVKYTNDIRHDFQRGVCNPKKEKFACFLVTNGREINYFNGKFMGGVEARNRIFHKLSLYKKVYSGGKYLNNIDEIVSGGQTQQWLSQCKFVIGYENMKYDGYITEKPFQAWFAGAIPLYYADESVPDINKNAVIYAGDFATEDEMVEYIKKVDNDDDLYCKIWNQQIITDPEKDYSVVREKLSKKLYEVIDRKLNIK